MITPTGECTQGYFCESGANKSTPIDGSTGNICPLGKYCPQGSALGTDCPPGRYGNTTGLAAETDCPLCDAGYYCPMPALTAPYQQCEAGHYCQIGAQYANPFNQTWGYLCPKGHYCPKGTPTPISCGRGTYQPDEGQSHIIYADHNGQGECQHTSI